MKKKILSVLLITVMLVSMLSMAFAAGISVSASYSDGMVSVTFSGASFHCEIWMDGTNTGRGGPNGTYSIPGTLSDGVHTVKVANVLGESGSASFRVGEVKPTAEPTAEPTAVPTAEPTAVPTPVPTAEPTAVPTPVPTAEPTPVPTAEPTAEPTPVPTEKPVGNATLDSVSYQNGVITYSVSGVVNPCEIWLDGANTHRSVSSNGTSSLTAKNLSEGNHTLMIYDPSMNRTSSMSFKVVFTAPSVSASAENGILAVTVSKVSAPSELWVDGVNTHRSIMTDGTVTLAMPFVCGTAHTVKVYTPSINQSGTASFVAGHNAGEPVVVDPTCVEKGTSTVSCKDCGAVISETSIDALGHKEGEAVVEKQPTCTEEGLSVVYCTECNEKLSETPIDALGHKEGEAAVEKQPTCTEEGLSVVRCTVCDEVISESPIPALGHTEGEAVVEKEATCAEEGLSVVYCSVCGEKLSETVLQKKPHQYAWVITKRPSYVAYGLRELICSVCGDVADQKILPKIIYEKEEEKSASVLLTTEGIPANELREDADANENVMAVDLTCDSILYMKLIANNEIIGYATITITEGTVMVELTINEGVSIDDLEIKAYKSVDAFCADTDEGMELIAGEASDVEGDVALIQIRGNASFVFGSYSDFVADEELINEMRELIAE